MRVAPAKVNPPPPQPPPPVQANQRTPCPELPQPANDRTPTLLENHDAVAALYHDCKDSKASLLRAMDEWNATAWAWYCKAVASVGISVTGCK